MEFNDLRNPFYILYVPGASCVDMASYRSVGNIDA